MCHLTESRQFNSYSPNVAFLYPLETSENLQFSDVFRGYRNVTLGEYGLNYVGGLPAFRNNLNHFGQINISLR